MREDDGFEFDWEEFRNSPAFPYIVMGALLVCLGVIGWSLFKMGGIVVCEKLGGGLLEARHECFIPDEEQNLLCFNTSVGGGVVDNEWLMEGLGTPLFPSFCHSFHTNAAGWRL